MMKAIAYPVMMIAGIGLVACFFLYIGSLAAPGLVPRLAPMATNVMFPGIFVVWLPTVLLMNRLTRDFKQRDLWKAALRGCPPWMKTGRWVVIGFVILAAFVVPLLRGQNPDTGSFLIFPASFYSVSFWVMYSLLHVDKLDAERRCLRMGIASRPWRSSARSAERPRHRKVYSSLPSGAKSPHQLRAAAAR